MDHVLRSYKKATSLNSQAGGSYVPVAGPSNPCLAEAFVALVKCYR